MNPGGQPDPPAEPADAPRNGLALLAFGSLFFFFLFAATIFPTTVTELAMDYAPRTVEPAPLNFGRELRDILIWAGVALVTIAFSLAAIIRSGTLIWRYCDRRTAIRAVVFLAATTVAASAISSGNNLFFDVAKELVCSVNGPEPGPSTQANPEVTIRPAVPVRAPYADIVLCSVWTERLLFSLQRADSIVFLKLLVNWSLIGGAVFVLGAMLFIAAARQSSAAGQFEHRRTLVENRTMEALLFRGGILLSLTTLADVLFFAWPLNLVPAGGDHAALLTPAFAGLTIYFGMIGTIVLVGAVLCANALLPKGPGLPTQIVEIAEAKKTAWLDGARKALFQRSTLQALAALSPLLTALVGNGVVLDLLSRFGA